MNQSSQQQVISIFENMRYNSIISYPFTTLPLFTTLHPFTPFPSHMPTITSTNPYTNEINGTFETLTDQQLTATIEKAHVAYQTRKNVPKSEKKALFLRMADLLDARAHEYGLLETREMGTLLTATTAGKKATASLIRWNANNFETVLGDELFASE